MASPNPRIYQYQVSPYFRKRVNYNDTNIGTGVKIGTIPAGSVITGTDVVVNTAFNAGTTNSLTIGGNSANYNDIAAASGTLCASTGLKQNIAPNASTAIGSLTADLDIYVMFQQTGTAASAGNADVIVHYVPNNDQ